MGAQESRLGPQEREVYHSQGATCFNTLRDRTERVRNASVVAITFRVAQTDEWLSTLKISGPHRARTLCIGRRRG